jgi:hypothetical protein
MHWNGTGDDLNDDTRDHQLEALLAELQTAPYGYGEVSVFDDSTGWAVTAFRGGGVMLYNAELSSPMSHLKDADPMTIWRILVMQGTDAVLQLDWQPGPPP